MTIIIARKLGVGRFAQVIAGIAVIIAGVYLSLGSSFSMNPFDWLFWALAFYIIILIVKNNNPKLWPVFGVITGLCLLSKYSMAFFGFGLIVGLLVTSQRKHLINKWFWLGGLVALVFLPGI